MCKKKKTQNTFFFGHFFLPGTDTCKIVSLLVLNGMRFYQQGDELLPQNKTGGGPMKAQTRSNDNLRCEGRNDFKAYRREHAPPRTSQAMPNDYVAPPPPPAVQEVGEPIGQGSKLVYQIVQI